MRLGYVATQQRNYQAALTAFRNALRQHPGDSYALKAIRNVQGYMRRRS
jgi:cytochrome c-type biogenesis protein CcmH/NrfG